MDKDGTTVQRLWMSFWLKWQILIPIGKFEFIPG